MATTAPKAPKAPKAPAALKNKGPRTQLAVDEKYTGSEPAWDSALAEKMTNEEFEHHLRKSMNYYNYYYTVKDLKKYVVEWLRNNGSFKPAEISAFDRSSDKHLPMTLCGVIMAARAGMPVRKKQSEYIFKNVRKLIDGAEPESLTTVTVAKPAAAFNIQDLLSERTNELMGEIEGHLDAVMLKKPVSFNPFDFLGSNNVPQSQLGKYEKAFGDMRAEFKEAQHGDDEQLKEAYRMWKTADFKRVNSFLDDILSAVQQYKAVKKATKKARVKKPVSKQKLVAKIKYCKEDKPLKLVSINPADIVGAGELWIYNKKTRKLGKFVADDYSTLSIKGTTVVNFSESKSVSKTLRKPEEKLKEFMKAGKVQMRKFLEDVRSVETRLKGRINEDVLLLRVA